MPSVGKKPNSLINKRFLLNRLTRHFDDPVGKLIFAICIEAIEDINRNVCDVCGENCKSHCEIKIIELYRQQELASFVNFVMKKEVIMKNKQRFKNISPEQFSDKDYETIDLIHEKQRKKPTINNSKESTLFVILPEDIKKKLDALAQKRGGYGQVKAIVIEALENYFKLNKR